MNDFAGMLSGLLLITLERNFIDPKGFCGVSNQIRVEMFLIWTWAWKGSFETKNCAT
jgi:hypothetical protein